MIYITYIQNSGGRSGHKLCEIFATFIFGILLDAKVLYNDSWDKQFIVSKESLIKHTFSASEFKFDHVMNVTNTIQWNSLSFDQFKNFKEEVINLNKKYTDLLINLSLVYKIHPHEIYHWYKSGNIREDLYSEKIIPLLKNLYYFDHPLCQQPKFCIHIRRGDLANRLRAAGFTVEYYKNIINIINQYLNIEIEIFCENENFHDILELANLKNTTLSIGGIDKLSDDFNCLCTSKFLLASPSSFSLFSTYLSQGIIFIDQKCIDFRIQEFERINGTPNIYVYENFIEMIKWLV